MGEPQKDFLALTHGEEWVSFYESFDKLVQDNLSRSSDLLKKAMTLPEVADREVAKVKDELETRLSEERDRQRAVLTELRDEVASGQRQISALSRGMGGLLTDLERLSGRITSALATVEETAAAPAESPSAQVAAVKPVTAPLNDAPKPQTAPLTAKPQTGSLAEAAATEETPIDLNALAEAETEKPAPAQELIGATNGSAERQRPAWLSVARPSGATNN
jgi:chromosome segregation ATPase